MTPATNAICSVATAPNIQGSGAAQQKAYRAGKSGGGSRAWAGRVGTDRCTGSTAEGTACSAGERGEDAAKRSGTQQHDLPQHSGASRLSKSYTTGSSRLHGAGFAATVFLARATSTPTLIETHPARSHASASAVQKPYCVSGQLVTPPEILGVALDGTTSTPCRRTTATTTHEPGCFRRHDTPLHPKDELKRRERDRVLAAPKMPRCMSRSIRIWLLQHFTAYPP